MRLDVRPLGQPQRLVLFVQEEEGVIPQNDPMNLYDKYGGNATVSRAVTNFYGEVLRRPHLRAYFQGVPMPKLIEHQVRFMSQVLGKTPSAYNGRTMAAAHGGLKITAEHFAEVGGILENALRHAGMEEADLKVAMGAVAQLQGQVVST